MLKLTSADYKAKLHKMQHIIHLIKLLQYLPCSRGGRNKNAARRA